MYSQFSVFLLLCSLLFGTLGARTVDELRVAYEVKMLAVEKEYQASLDKLATGYKGALEQVQKKLQKSGRLDDVLKIVDEKKTLKEGKWPLGKLDPSSPADLIKFRKIYETSRIRAERSRASEVIKVADRMEKLLQAQMKTLTQAGNIDEAKDAKILLEKIQNAETVGSARELIDRVRLNSKSPLAYRLRRSGDHLEVLVRFDRSGQVSLDSPVENVVEITGGKAEKGKTDATLLGEFVGAKGYKSTPFVAYESSMEKIISPMNSSGFQLKPRVEIKGHKSMKITLGNKVKNPYVSWSGILAPLGSQSQMKLEVDYLIPKENKTLKEFSFQLGMGNRFGNKVLSQTGRWVTESLESESVTANSMLLLYGNALPKVGELISGGDESIYLKNMKFTYLSFAAHIVEKYDGEKSVGAPVVEPTAQKPLVLSGKLLPPPKE